MENWMTGRWVTHLLLILRYPRTFARFLDCKSHLDIEHMIYPSLAQGLNSIKRDVYYKLQPKSTEKKKFHAS